MEAHKENIIVVHCKGGKGEGWESGDCEGVRMGEWRDERVEIVRV